MLSANPKCLCVKTGLNLGGERVYWVWTGAPPACGPATLWSAMTFYGTPNRGFLKVKVTPPSGRGTPTFSPASGLTPTLLPALPRGAAFEKGSGRGGEGSSFSEGQGDPSSGRGPAQELTRSQPPSFFQPPGPPHSPMGLPLR